MQPQDESIIVGYYTSAEVHLSLIHIFNDGTCEGLGYVGKNIFTVQFHPEASPGPVDSDYLFDEFMRCV